MRQLLKCMVAAACALPLATMADTPMTNPVTGETETYVNSFTGSGDPAEWNSTDNWDTETTPFIVTTYTPALVDGKAVSTSTAIDGWTLRVGAYNGASVTWSGGITKIQAGSDGCWLTADETSSITIASFAGNQLEGGDSVPFKLSSANAGGITWSAGLTSASNTSLPFWYYLKGSGTVVYGGDITVANAQVIKQADVTLSGTSQVASKTLVTFGSGTTKTFTADATIKRLNSSGTDLNDDAHLAAVNATGTTTLTTSDAVGTCELVQTSTGIELFWVDGDPAALTPTVYKPSININFTHSGVGLTTVADVGVGEYAVPGTSWSNMAGSNGSSSTIYGVDSTGEKSLVAGASVTVSGAYGSYRYTGVDGNVDLRYGYIDDAQGTATPQVVVDGIPYYKYQLVLYFSNDTNGRPFGHLTINGTNYKWDSTEGAIVTCEGTVSDVWGSSSGTALTEGGNYLVFPAMENPDGKLTIVGHRWSGTQRMGVAAIQIVEVKPDAGADDLVIEVSGSTEYTVADAKELTGTVYITGNGTLTLTGEAKISAATINVGPSVTLIVNSDRLDGTTFTGAGTVAYDGVVPPTGKGWTESTWTGTVWLKNQSISSFEGNQYGNAGSTIRFTGVTGFLQSNTFNSKGYVHTVPLELVDDGDTVALTYNNGWGGNLIKINTLKGSGTLKTQGSGLGEHIYIVDGSGFTGVFNLTGKYVYVGGSQPDYSATTNPNGKLDIRAGTTLTVPAGKTWTANGGYVVNGALVANGTLASTAETAISGSGTVTFGGVPSPTGDAWWKNSEWTGTVEIKGVTALNGDYVFNNYGNAASTLKLTNCSGWLKPNYTCAPALEIGGTFTWNDGSSGLNNTFKVATLKGSGTISIPSGGAATAVWQITDDWAGFTGAVVGNNSSAARVLVFGATLPTTVTAGEIYISEGATLNLDNSSSAWWGVGMGFIVDGTVKATSRAKWGGGTYMTLGDTGVLEITRSDTAYNDDGGTDYGNVTGTGTIRFAGDGFAVISQSIPTALTFAAEKASGSVVPIAGATIGSLTGSGGFRSDWGNNGEAGRYLTIKQSKDTDWDGSINVGGTHRLTGVVVDPGDSATGTLTLTATQTATSTLAVNGSVNLTGTWVGATTVAGTFGGTGTLTGDLTFSDGATFKANATALTVSGAVTLPTAEGESLTIDATALEDDEVTILSSSSITTETDVSKVTVNGLYTVEPDVGALKLVSTKVAVTVPTIPNTTVTVTVGGETIGTEPGAYKVAPDSVVTVTYAAAPGYEISGTTEYTIDTSKSETTFDPAETTHVAQYVAYVVFQQEVGLSYEDVTNYYTTVSNAIEAASALKKAVYLVATPDAADTYNISVGETVRIAKGGFTYEGIVFPQGAEFNNTTIETGGITLYSCALYTAIITYADSTQEASSVPLGQLLLTLWQTYTPAKAGLVVRSLDGSDAALADDQAIGTLYTYNSEAHTFTLKPMVASVSFEQGGVQQTQYVPDFALVLQSAMQYDVTATLLVDLDMSSWGSGMTIPGSVEYNEQMFDLHDITLNLGGKTITGPADGYALVNAGADITITGEGIVEGAGIVSNATSTATTTISGGTYTATGDLFAAEEGSTIAVSGGTFNKTVDDEYIADGYEVKDNGDGTYGIREDMGWIYSAPGAWDYTGTWEGATLGDDKVTIETNATYTASTPSEKQIVTLNMTLSFDDVNDEEIDLSDVKAAVRLGKVNEDYVFQLATWDGAEAVWTNATAAVDVTTNTDYHFLFVLDLTNKTYTAAVITDAGATTNELSVADSTTLYFANYNQGEAAPVRELTFIGSGSVSSLTGSYEDAPLPPEFVKDEVVTLNGGSKTLTANEAAWLNACGGGDKATVGGKIGNLSAAAFNRAYLLNLDVCDDNYSDVEKPLSVTAISVGDTTVTVTVTVTRNGAFANEGINGTLTLKGAAALDSSFDVISTAEFEDEDFSESDTTSTTFNKGEDPAKFYKAVIE